MLTREEVHSFMKMRTQMTETERESRFRSLVKEVGAADPATQKFRQECRDMGFRVVFRSGLSRSQTLAALNSKSTSKILASHT